MDVSIEIIIIQTNKHISDDRTRSENVNRERVKSVVFKYQMCQE